jgi:hypothetical protein
MRETAPRPIMGLGAVRPSWCPPATVPQDVCEIKYSVDIPYVGREEVGLPIYRVTYDALQAVSKFLPERLPEWYAAALPYIENLRRDTVEELTEVLEREVDYLSSELMAREVDPRIADIEDKVRGITNELVVTTAALSGAVMIVVALSAWWIRRKV